MNTTINANYQEQLSAIGVTFTPAIEIGEKPHIAIEYVYDDDAGEGGDVAGFDFENEADARKAWESLEVGGEDEDSLGTYRHVAGLWIGQRHEDSK
jgi:hypothetical protein